MRIYGTEVKEMLKETFLKLQFGKVNGLWTVTFKQFGGSPEEHPENYVKYSIYSQSEKDGGNARYLINIPIRLYTEPGIIWQMENRHNDLYDLNCTDISAMINFITIKRE